MTMKNEQSEMMAVMAMPARMLNMPTMAIMTVSAGVDTLPAAEV